MNFTQTEPGAENPTQQFISDFEMAVENMDEAELVSLLEQPRLQLPGVDNSNCL